MLVRRLARLLLASTFLVEGARTLRNPPVEGGTALPAGLGQRIPYLPDDTRTVTRITGGVQAGAGLLLALGKFPRLASFALAASLVPGTAASHRFWEEKDPQLRADQQSLFVKNVSLAGGLMIAAADTQGRPGLAWRTRHAGKTTKHAVRASKREAKLAGKVAQQKASRTAGRTARSARGARSHLPG